MGKMPDTDKIKEFKKLRKLYKEYKDLYVDPPERWGEGLIKMLKNELDGDLAKSNYNIELMEKMHFYSTDLGLKEIEKMPLKQLNDMSLQKKMALKIVYQEMPPTSVNAKSIKNILFKIDKSIVGPKPLHLTDADFKNYVRINQQIDFNSESKENFFNLDRANHPYKQINSNWDNLSTSDKKLFIYTDMNKQINDLHKKYNVTPNESDIHKKKFFQELTKLKEKFSNIVSNSPYDLDFLTKVHLYDTPEGIEQIKQMSFEKKVNLRESFQRNEILGYEKEIPKKIEKILSNIDIVIADTKPVYLQEIDFKIHNGMLQEFNLEKKHWDNLGTRQSANTEEIKAIDQINDKYRKINANWDNLPLGGRRIVIATHMHDHVNKLHNKHYPPFARLERPINFKVEKLGKGVGGFYRNSERLIVLGKQYLYNVDFIMNTVEHENQHAKQHHFADMHKSGKMSKVQNKAFGAYAKACFITLNGKVNKNIKSIYFKPEDDFFKYKRQFSEDDANFFDKADKNIYNKSEQEYQQIIPDSEVKIHHNKLNKTQKNLHAKLRDNFRLHIQFFQPTETFKDETIRIVVPDGHRADVLKKNLDFFCGIKNITKAKQGNKTYLVISNTEQNGSKLTNGAEFYTKNPSLKGKNITGMFFNDIDMIEKLEANKNKVIGNSITPDAPDATTLKSSSKNFAQHHMGKSMMVFGFAGTVQILNHWDDLDNTQRTQAIVGAVDMTLGSIDIGAEITALAAKKAGWLIKSAETMEFAAVGSEGTRIANTANMASKWGARIAGPAGLITGVFEIGMAFYNYNKWAKNNSNMTQTDYIEMRKKEHDEQILKIEKIAKELEDPKIAHSKYEGYKKVEIERGVKLEDIPAESEWIEQIQSDTAITLAKLKENNPADLSPDQQRSEYRDFRKNYLAQKEHMETNKIADTASGGFNTVSGILFTAAAAANVVPFFGQIGSGILASAGLICVGAGIVTRGAIKNGVNPKAWGKWALSAIDVFGTDFGTDYNSYINEYHYVEKGQELYLKELGLQDEEYQLEHNGNNIEIDASEAMFIAEMIDKGIITEETKSAEDIFLAAQNLGIEGYNLERIESIIEKTNNVDAIYIQELMAVAKKYKEQEKKSEEMIQAYTKENGKRPEPYEGDYITQTFIKNNPMFLILKIFNTDNDDTDNDEKFYENIELAQQTVKFQNAIDANKDIKNILVKAFSDGNISIEGSAWWKDTEIKNLTKTEMETLKKYLEKSGIECDDIIEQKNGKWTLELADGGDYCKSLKDILQKQMDKSSANDKACKFLNTNMTSIFPLSSPATSVPASPEKLELNPQLLSSKNSQNI